ncbi:MAG: hypothetical protein JNM79_03590 [Burkholderiales bacterium]|nr:hypothetical protein [Burkholderiales bacterium]
MPAGRPPHPTLERLRRCLAEERHAMMSGDADAVRLATAAKEAALDDLKKNATRIAPGEAPRVRSLARVNRDNQRIAAVRLDYMNARLSGLMRAADPVPAGILYGQDGNALSRPAVRRFAGHA